LSRRRPIGRPPRQSPYKRTYEDGRVVWVARFRDLRGNTLYAKPRWNGGKASFHRRGDAQRAIDEALAEQRGRGELPRDLGTYFGEWLSRHPRSARTNKTYSDRVRYGLDVEIDGLPLRDWGFDDLRRRHVHDLLSHLLVDQGRAAEGARGILRALSTMTEDAIGDDAAATKPFMGVRLSGSDPRIKKPPRKIRVWTFEQMREFAAAGRVEVRTKTPRPVEGDLRRGGDKHTRFYSPHDYEAALLTLGLTGLRLGELLGLDRSNYRDLLLRLLHSAHDGQLVPSSRQKNHERNIPVPPSLAGHLDRIVAEPGEDDAPLFATPRGRRWSERNFYRDVWTPAKIASGMNPTPHEFRHSYVTQLRAASIDDADLAKVAGHRVETMISVYTHPLDRSHDAIRGVIG
jgi:integrase